MKCFLFIIRRTNGCLLLQICVFEACSSVAGRRKGFYPCCRISEELRHASKPSTTNARYTSKDECFFAHCNSESDIHEQVNIPALKLDADLAATDTLE